MKKLPRKAIDINPDLSDYVMIAVMTMAKARTAKTKKVENTSYNVHLEAMNSMMNYLNKGGFLSVGGFINDIGPEHRAFQDATLALRKKIMDTSILYLDAEGRPREHGVYWANNSEDAD